MRKYTDCYIAFLDLLGFKSLIGNTDCEEIAQIFDEINQHYAINENETPMVEYDEIHYKVMSDSICVYINSEIENSLLVLILLCTFLQVRLLRLTSPILVRGGITKGDIYANGDILFGPGLSGAYVLESNLAKYPRVIIPLNIIDDYKKTIQIKESFFSSFLFEDFDGFYSINYFDTFMAWGYKAEDGERVKKLIYNMLCSNCQHDVREKYLYLQSHIIPKIEKAKEQS